MSNINHETTQGVELHGLELQGIESFVHFGSDQTTTFHREPPEYWSHPTERRALTEGRILSVFEYDTTWSHWERHPRGDELAFVLYGAVDLLLDQPSGTETIRLHDAECGLIPEGAWHTLRVLQPSRILFVTPTPAMTEHRDA